MLITNIIVTDITGINTQTDTTESVETTTIDLNYTQSEGFREARKENGSFVFMVDDDGLNATISEDFPHDAPESASRVLVANKPNGTNEFKIEDRKVPGPPVKHPIKMLPGGDNQPIISKNVKDSIKAHVRYDEVTGELMNGDHPCNRECREGEEPMICYYHFVLEWYQTMSKACYDCPYNLTDCTRPDCIPADGMNRPLNVVNRKMPGPAVEVSEKYPPVKFCCFFTQNV